MGYQETYLRMKDSKDFGKLVDAIKSAGQRKFFIAEPVELITLKQPIEGDLSKQCHPETRYSFDKGEQFIYVAGDRGSQRSPGAFFRQTDNIPEFAKDIEIYATECFPSYQIFNDKEIAEREPFKW